MKLIAMTGGIGSGKTTVADYFVKLGVPVIDTDVIARQIVSKNGIAYQSVVDEFGTEILDNNHEINRPALRKIIFSSKKKKTTLESILHPLIWEQVQTELQALDTAYIIIVVPLLFESSPAINFDRILVIDTPVENQISRVINRDEINEQEVMKIINSQVTREERIEKADDILLNTDKERLENAVKMLHAQYLEMSARK